MHLKTANVVPKHFELFEGLRFPRHPVSEHDFAKHTNDNEDILVPFSTCGTFVYHYVGLNVLKQAHRLVLSTA